MRILIMWEKHLTEAKARTILATREKVDVLQRQWLEHWVETLVREQSLPPQLASPSFHDQLLAFAGRERALEILGQLRVAYAQRYPAQKTLTTQESEWTALLAPHHDIQ